MDLLEGLENDLAKIKDQREKALKLFLQHYKEEMLLKSKSNQAMQEMPLGFNSDFERFTEAIQEFLEKYPHLLRGVSGAFMII